VRVYKQKGSPVGNLDLLLNKPKGVNFTVPKVNEIKLLVYYVIGQTMRSILTIYLALDG